MLSNYRRAALLTGASISVLAFAAPVLAGTPTGSVAAPAAAATVEGIRQDAGGTIAINLFELDESDPEVDVGVIDQVVNPGAQAVASAEILCAELSSACSQPGAVEQFANGSATARNELVIGGELTIGASAAATGATATATARIETGILQQAISGGEASNSVDVSGSIAVVASAEAVATNGSAMVLAAITQAMVLSATGATSAAIDLTNSGSISIGVSAVGSAQGSGSESAFVGAVTFGIDAVGLATGAGQASIELTNDGDIALDAEAHAAAPGLALATAAALAAVNATAVAVQGDALIAIENAGDLALAADAQAMGGHTGIAIANANGALFINANGFGAGDASVAIVNSGSLTLDAAAQAQATTNATAIAIAATAIFEAAHAATGDALLSIDNVGAIEIMADATATGLIARASVVAGGGIFAGGVFQSANAASGNAAALLVNDGTIVIDANAEANGSVSATANAFGGPAVAQFAFADGGDADAQILNSGSILLTADAEAVATNSASANALFSRGVVGVAIADLAGLGGDASVELVNDGDLVVAANAHALADSFAFGRAAVSGLVGADGFNFGNGDAQALLVNSGSIEIGANAAATGATAFAIATATNVIFETADSFGDGLGQAELVNEGTIEIDATATANGVIATAGAFLNQGITQGAGGGAGADASISNSGTIEFAASALAESDDTGSAFAVATAAGIFQRASALSTSFTVTSSAGTGTFHFTTDPSGPASIQLENDGSISVAAHAIANGGSDAQAQAIVAGATQSANGLTMDVLLANSGTIDVVASASASATGLAVVDAQATGIRQNAAGIARTSTFFFSGSGSTSNSSTSVVGSAMVQLDNSGTISVGAMAEASGDFAIANAFVTGVAQTATGTAAAAVLDNSGMLHVLAQARATGSNAFVQGTALGVDQLAVGEDEASVSFTNSGTFQVVADAAIEGERASGGEIAIGLHQSPEAVSGSAEAINAGTLAVAARVKATGAAHADGQAFAVGIQQNPFRGDFTAVFDNSGTLNAIALVTAVVDDGGTAFGAARATAYEASGHRILADHANSGTISVLASVGAMADGGSAVAQAVGLDVEASASTAPFAPGSIEGTLDNSGMLTVRAGVSGSGGAGTQAAQSQAFATGIRLSAGSIDATLTNSGKIAVDAVSAGGGIVGAAGIVATGNGIVGNGSAILTINNSGDLIVRQSIDGGLTWSRGTAIDLGSAPNASLVNLLGGGQIYGDIVLRDGDRISVEGGETRFYGIINPSFVPAGGIGAGNLDQGLFGVGTLDIASGGNLIISDPRIIGPAITYDGSSYLFVESFNVASGGTVTFELQPAQGGAQPVGSYSQIFADTAMLNGTLVASVATANGLFEDSYFWDNLIDANMLIGEFDACRPTGAGAGSVLLAASCSYDSGANVDLTLSRVAFSAVDGLNRNAAETGEGLESVYDPSLTGGIAAIFADLFRIGDGAAYNVALNQLSGSSYANYLQSFPSLGVRYNDLIDHGADCEGQPLEGSALSCRAPSSIKLWGQLDVQRRTASGDVEAGTARSRRFTTLVGLDVYVGDSVLVGVTGGAGSNHTRDRKFGDLVDGDGTLLGAYVVYDPGAFFVKGVTTYSWFDGDSGRRINFQGLAPALSFSARPEADPDVKLFTAGLHGGARFPIASNSVITPYLNLDYVHSRLDGFTEAGNSGAELSVGGGKAGCTFVSSGVKWAGRIGDVVPEASVSYRHRFGSKRTTIQAAFLGGNGSDFNVVSAAQDRGSILAGLSLGGTVGRVGLRVSYDGEFSDDVTSHSGNFKLVLPLGGAGSLLGP